MFKNGYQLKQNSQMVKRRDHTPITGKKVKNQVNKITPKSGTVKQQRISFIQKKQTDTNESVENQSIKQAQVRPTFYQNAKNSTPTMNQRPPSSNIQKDILTKMNQGKSENRPGTSSFEVNNANTSLSNASVIISQVKQLGNKSVLIVKPNQLGANNNPINQNGLSQSRYDKRRVQQSNDNKQNRFSLNKDNSVLRDSNKDYMKNSKVSNFFRMESNLQNDRNNNTDRQMKILKRQDNNMSSTINRSSQIMNGNKYSSSSLSSKIASNVTGKLRSSSTRVTRKQQLSSTINSISKNHSYTGKGKWKM